MAAENGSAPAAKCTLVEEIAAISHGCRKQDYGCRETGSLESRHGNARHSHNNRENSRRGGVVASERAVQFAITRLTFSDVR